MWFVLFGVGAAFLYRVRLPPAVARLAYPPPLELRYALYFLVVVLVRLAICDLRVGALERRARRSAGPTRAFNVSPPRLIEVGAGVGKGVAEVVLGDIMGATLAAAALLLRFAASRRGDPRLAARRAAERRRAATRERRMAALCILGVGLVCIAAVWLPLVHTHVVALAAELRTWTWGQWRQAGS